jgi:lysophospholipase L1-like esterase
MSGRRMSHGRGRAALFALKTLIAALALSAGFVQSASADKANAPKPDALIWAASWYAAPEPQRGPINLANTTVRMVARTSIGGPYVRIQLSNEFGDKPLIVGAAHVALSAAGSAIRPETDNVLKFGGSPSVTIPTGARVLSDPVYMKVPGLSNLTVSLYFPQPTGTVTAHYFSNQTAYTVSGDATAAQDLSGATSMTNQIVLTGVQVEASARNKVVVTLGDSLTGGFGSTVDAYRSWPDLEATLLANPNRKPVPFGVVNAAIGGNRLLHDFLGPNALSRFDRDVLGQPNVSYLFVLLGINDFGLPGGRNLPDENVSAQDVIIGYEQLIARAHADNILVYIATIPPFGPIPGRPGYYSDEADQKRAAVNSWIRTNFRNPNSPYSFDGMFDFEAALRDPKTPNRLLAKYDSGDHLDPNDAGYKAMFDSIDQRYFDESR